MRTTLAAVTPAVAVGLEANSLGVAWSLAGTGVSCIVGFMRPSARFGLRMHVSSSPAAMNRQCRTCSLGERLKVKAVKATAGVLRRPLG